MLDRVDASAHQLEANSIEAIEPGTGCNPEISPPALRDCDHRPRGIALLAPCPMRILIEAALRARDGRGNTQQQDRRQDRLSRAQYPRPRKIPVPASTHVVDTQRGPLPWDRPALLPPNGE